MTSVFLGNRQGAPSEDRGAGARRARFGWLPVAALAGALVAAFVPRSEPMTSVRAGARTTPVTPTPATRTEAGSGQGSGSTGDPPANITPSPNFLTSCSGSAYDDSAPCLGAVLAAIANARNQEGLPSMALPSDWAQLSPQQQLFVATNLE